MATGLVALLDDIAAITKLAAASLDDVGAAAGRAGAKAAGVVVDDTAVTPRYVTGFTPDRELPIIARIARGSLFNKLVILLPAAMLLSAFAPWAITPLLMIGGAFLCFEGAEKLIEAVFPHAEEDLAPETTDPAELEKLKIAGAVRTDFILSAEIMAIALGEVSTEPLLTQGVTLLVVALAITAAVYGVVGLIVKMDDIGLHMAKGGTGAGRGIGRLLVKGMPVVMSILSTVGIAAMLWVGGQIVLHGMHEYHLTPLPEWVEHAGEGAAQALPAIGGAVNWIVQAALSGVFGVVLGGLIAGIVHLIVHKKKHG